MPNAVLLPWEDENNNTTGSFNKKRRVTPIAWTNVTNASVITTELPDGGQTGGANQYYNGYCCR
jgi:hypothetical protein